MMGAMPRNVEIKARVLDWDAMRQRAAALAGGPVQILELIDRAYVDMQTLV